MDLQDLIRQNMVLALVQRSITCPVTGEILDVRTCVVLIDQDGDPRAVLSQRGWAEIQSGNLGDAKAQIERMGLTANPDTVKAE